MAWVRAVLRGQRVYARADDSGALQAQGGRVEIRYNAGDGRAYRARADNLQVVDKTPLPDHTCVPEGAPAARAEPEQGATRTPARGSAKREPKKPAPPMRKAHPDAVHVYADGACSGNPGPAGLGVVVLDRAGAGRIERSEYLGEGTNNIAELTAVLRALEELPDQPLLIHTDSQYTIGVVLKGWKAKANVDLVAELREVLAGRPDVALKYVPGHAGVAWNERADELAREAVRTRRTRREVVPWPARESGAEPPAG